MDGRHPRGAFPYLIITEDEIPEWIKPYGMEGMWLYMGMVWGAADAARILTGKIDID